MGDVMMAEKILGGLFILAWSIAGAYVLIEFMLLGV